MTIKNTNSFIRSNVAAEVLKVDASDNFLFFSAFCKDPIIKIKSCLYSGKCFVKALNTDS